MMTTYSSSALNICHARAYSLKKKNSSEDNSAVELPASSLFWAIYAFARRRIMARLSELQTRRFVGLIEVAGESNERVVWCYGGGGGGHDRSKVTLKPAFKHRRLQKLTRLQNEQRLGTRSSSSQNEHLSSGLLRPPNAPPPPPPPPPLPGYSGTLTT